MKKNRLNLFKKTLFTMILLMIGIILISYLSVYFLLPSFYMEYKESRIEQEVLEIQEKCEADSLDMVQTALTGMARDKSADIKLLDSERNIVFQINQVNGTAYDFGTEKNVNKEIDGEKVEEEYIEVEEIQENDLSEEREMLSFSYPVLFQEKSYVLDINVPKEPLEDARKVLVLIFPFALGISGIVAFGVAYVFSNYVSKPIQRMKKTAEEMEELLPEARVAIKRKDEIGELGESLNQLYETLKSSIDNLEKQMLTMEAEEEEKIQFFMNISHELKTPLMSASALLEGMIYKIPPYQDYEKYLPECLEILQNATDMTKKSLDLSANKQQETREVQMKELVQECLKGYKMLIASKQITLTIDLEEEMLVQTIDKKLRTALSNVISNAVYHTASGGRIRIYTKEQKQLVVENSCEPLSDTEVQKLFEPYSRKEGEYSKGNGLGLYLTRHTLTVLNIPYSFSSNEEGDGMQFIFRFIE